MFCHLFCKLFWGWLYRLMYTFVMCVYCVVSHTVWIIKVILHVWLGVLLSFVTFIIQYYTRIVTAIITVALPWNKVDTLESINIHPRSNVNALVSLQYVFRNFSGFYFTFLTQCKSCIIMSKYMCYKYLY